MQVEYEDNGGFHGPDGTEAVLQAAVESTLDEARRQGDRIIAEAVEHGLEIVTEAREKSAALDTSALPRRIEQIEADLVSGLDRVERRLAQRTEALVLRLATPGDEVEPSEDERWSPLGTVGDDPLLGPANSSSGADDLTIDHDDLVVRVGSREIPLTPMQARILEVLLAHAGQVVHRSTLLQRVWGTDNPLFNSAVERQIELMQQELEDDPANPTRITKSQVGYRYRGPAIDGLSEARETP